MSVKSIMFEIEGLIKNAVMSCAAMYGFSAEEALAKIDANGNLIRVVDKEAEKQKKEAEKAEKQRIKEAEKVRKEAEKVRKEAEKVQKETEKIREKASKKAEKVQKETEKIRNEAEIAFMKEEDILSKAAEKLALKQKKEAEKPRRGKCFGNIKISRIIKSSEDEPFIRFQNIPLIDEINSIRDVKKFKNWKKLSAGVKLARQIMDI